MLSDTAPVVSFVAEANVAVTSGWSVTVSGVDFGFADATLTFGLGLSSCLTSTWVSATSAACLAALGSGPLAEVLATVSTIVGTQTSVFSYDGIPTVPCNAVASVLRSCYYEQCLSVASRSSMSLVTRSSVTAPVVSFVGEKNAVTSAGWSVTVSGLGFGSLDATPSSQLGLSNCLTATWASSTSVVCFLAPGEGPEKDSVATVSSVAGTRTRTFSYDCAAGHFRFSEAEYRINILSRSHRLPILCPAPVVSFLADTNIVATASFSVTVSGVNFGALDFTASSRIGTSSCQTTAWVSGTSVACLMSLGVGTGLAAQATVSAVAGTQTTVFTYDSAASPLPRSLETVP